MTVTADIDERISKCQKILDDDPNSQIFAALAEAYRKKGELERAFKTCQNGLRIHPSYGLAHVIMAKVNLDRGMYDWAEVEVNKAVDLDGSSRATELLLAEIHIYKGEFQAAIRLLKKLNADDPDNGQIRKLLAIAKRIPEEQETMVASSPPSSQPATEEEEAVDEKPAVTSKADVLRSSLEVENVQAALFCDNEGLVGDAEWHGRIDKDTCGAVMAEICNEVTLELTRTPFGMTSSVLIESAKDVFYIVRRPVGMFVFVAGIDVNLGSLRMKVNSLIDEYIKLESGS